MPFIAAAVGAVVAAIEGSAILATIAIAAIEVGISFISRALIGTPKSPSSNNSLADQGVTMTSRNATAPRQVIYGNPDNVKGTIVFIHTTGVKNEWLHLVVTLAGHQVDSISFPRFDGVEVPLDGTGVQGPNPGTGNCASGQYAGFVYQDVRLGAPSQTAYAALMANAPDMWTANHRGDGVASIYLAVKWDEKAFPNGLPALTWQVKGKNDILDPRTGTRGYTTNSILCVRDYYTWKWGLNVPDAGMNDTTIAAEANVCDEQVECTLARDTFVGTGSSDFSTGFASKNAIDGSPATAWSSLVGQSGEINYTVDLGAASTFHGLMITPRQDWDRVSTGGPAPGDLTGYSVYVSDDGSAWGSAIATGTLPADGSVKTIRFAQQTKRYVKVVRLDSALNVSFCMADINVIAYENRYTTNGITDLSLTRGDIIKKLLTACGGYPSFAAGLWSLYSAHWTGSVGAIGDDDIIGDGLERTSRVPRDQIFNGVKGIFISPQNKWQPSDFPAYTRGEDTASDPWLAEDGGVRIWNDIELPFTSSASTAQRLAKIQLEQQRRQNVVRFTAKLGKYKYQAGDVISFTHPRYGAAWTNKTLQVAESQWAVIDGTGDITAPALGVAFTMREADADIYAWDVLEEQQILLPSAPTLPTLKGADTSTGFNGQGSLVPDQALIVSYSFTDTTIALTWASQGKLRADGSTLTVAAGSKSYSGLTPSTDYYIYSRVKVDDPTPGLGTIGFANPDPPPTSPNAVYAAQASLDGFSPLQVIHIRTAAASSPGGGGTGGGGDVCPEAAELVRVRDRGDIRAIDVEVGDWILGRSFAQGGAEVYRRVIAKRTKQAAAWRMLREKRVSPCEPVWIDGAGWLPAFRAPGSTFDGYLGTRVDLSVEADVYDEANYLLVAGEPLLIHNINTIVC